MLRPKRQLDVLRSRLERRWHWYPERYHARVGHRDSIPYVSRPIRRHRIHTEYFWCRCCVLDRIVSVETGCEK